MNEKKILIVEDSPTDLHKLRSTLAQGNYRVRAAQSGEEALELARNDPPDVVLLDVVLPQKSGFEVCRELKGDPATAGAKIIMVSSKNERADRFWGQKQGADGYLGKPYDEKELLELVASHL